MPHTTSARRRREGSSRRLRRTQRWTRRHSHSLPSMDTRRWRAAWLVFSGLLTWVGAVAGLHGKFKPLHIYIVFSLWKVFPMERASDWNAIAPEYMGLFFSRVGHFFCCSVMARTIENKKLGAATMFDIVSTQLFSNEPTGLRSGKLIRLFIPFCCTSAL